MLRTAIVVALASSSAIALADTAAGGGDPVANHTIALEDATKGVKGSGTLMAKIDVEQGGKMLGSFTCRPTHRLRFKFELRRVWTFANQNSSSDLKES